MSWLFSLALVEAFSAGTCSDGVVYVPLKSTSTAAGFSFSVKTMEHSRRSRYGTTFERLPVSRGRTLLTSFLAAFRARTSRKPAKVKASKESGLGFGGRWQELSVRFDLASSSLRTHRLLWDEALHWSSVTLPRWGLIVGGVFWEQLTQERHISEIGFGSWRGIERESNQKVSQVRFSKANLAQSGHLTQSGFWPTPTVSGNYNRKGSSAKSRDGLATAVMKSFWTTPSASDATRGGRITSKMSGSSLVQQVNTPTRWPTPTATDATKWNLKTAEERKQKGQSVRLCNAVNAGGRLNPLWVEWLMGWPLGWTALKPLEMDRFQQWSSSH